MQEASFFVRAGEIYGIAGVSGNGQSELGEALIGARQPTAGEIWIENLGNVVHDPASNRRIAAVAAIPADRYSFALAGGLSIADNFTVAEIRSGRYGSLGRLNRAAMQRETRRGCRRLRRSGRAQHEAEGGAVVRR